MGDQPEYAPTARIIENLELHGYRPSGGEVDTRPLPEDKTISYAMADIFDALVSTLSDTSLERDLPDLLWSTVNIFHKSAERAQRELDSNVDEQRRSQDRQDGSEIRSVELEDLTTLGEALTERRDTYELMRECAGEFFEMHTGSHWRPRSGSQVAHRAMTAAMIDSRDFIAAKRRAETEILMPAGTKIAVAGGVDYNDHHLIWQALDRVRAKHPYMVLLHGGSPKGAERIAACWADSRGVVQIVFKPDWARHAKAAPFKRNDELLATLPAGVVVFPGSGITENLADKARKLGIPVWRSGA